MYHSYGTFIEKPWFWSKSNMWYDLRKPVTWCKIDIFSYWYHVKVWIILFPELFTWISSDTGIKSYICSKAIKIKKKIGIIMLISFILQFHLLRHVTGFPRSHHILIIDLSLPFYSKQNKKLGYAKLFNFSFKCPLCGPNMLILWYNSVEIH